MSKTPRKIMAIASGGGHWVQMRRLKPAFEGAEVFYVSIDPSSAADVPGRFEIDALPQAGRIYYRDSEESDGTRAGKPTFTPNLYQRNVDGEPGEEEETQTEPEDNAGKASLVDARSDTKTEKKKFALWPWK